jgi:hypothetical protein
MSGGFSGPGMQQIYCLKDRFFIGELGMLNMTVFTAWTNRSAFLSCDETESIIDTFKKFTSGNC